MDGDGKSAGGQSYLSGGEGATAGLAGVVMERIDAEGGISFREFMGTVLYHEEWGYYARDLRRTGREGDFFTSVSVGPLFGRLLGEHVRGVWGELGKPAGFRVVEWGAEDGQLAADILAAAEEAGWELGYAIVEPLAGKRERLRERFGERVEVVAEAGELEARPGVVLANELLDALPVWLVRFEDGEWKEKVVVREGEGLGWGLRAVSGELGERLGRIGRNFPEGYETEIRPSCAGLLSEMAGVLDGGEVVLVDYGFERGDYYVPERREGTLETYGKHRRGRSVFEGMGELDITAHVDWTAVEEDAAEVGLGVVGFERQGSFLTRVGADWLRALEGKVDGKMVGQFQMLTHPGQLGTKFWVMRVARF
ncbi:MAG: SAM-dependent methyltransferase [Verrucomicrobiota bacterium]